MPKGRFELPNRCDNGCTYKVSQEGDRQTRQGSNTGKPFQTARNAEGEKQCTA